MAVRRPLPARLAAAALAATGFMLPGIQAARASEGEICRRAILAAEAARRIPDAFLAAIGRVESGRADPASGVVAPWPWTVNARGAGTFYASKAEAVAAVKALQAEGVRSIDVGCLQVNLMHHPEAFATLEQAFDPAANATFAASLLVSLFAQTGSWPHAAAAYHSQTPTIGADYQKKVLAEWASPPDPAGNGKPRPEAKGAPAAKLADSGSAPPASWGGHAITRFAFPAPSAHAPTGQTGRDLAAYRTVPVPLAWRAVRLPGHS